MKALVLILALLSPGCATLSSEQATIGCQIADGATTLRAISLGAHEANPLVAATLHVFGPAGLVIVKLAAVYMILQVREEHPALAAAANVATCGVAVRNLLVVR